MAKPMTVLLPIAFLPKLVEAVQRSGPVFHILARNNDIRDIGCPECPSFALATRSDHLNQFYQNAQSAVNIRALQIRTEKRLQNGVLGNVALINIA